MSMEEIIKMVKTVRIPDDIYLKLTKESEKLN